MRDRKNEGIEREGGSEEGRQLGGKCRLVEWVNIQTYRYHNNSIFQLKLDDKATAELSNSLQEWKYFGFVFIVC